MPSTKPPAVAEPLLCKWPAGRHAVCGCGISADWPLCQSPCRDSTRQHWLDVRRSGARVWICRCGASRQWPHCDGSHNRLAKG